MAGRFIDVSLEKRGVSCTAKLLDDRAPITCEAVWNALPQSGDVHHAKYARNEVHTLVPAFAPAEPPLENPTVTPIPGDLCHFTFTDVQLGTPSYGYEAEAGHRGGPTVVDLALFCERNNLLTNGDARPTAGRSGSRRSRGNNGPAGRAVLFRRGRSAAHAPRGGGPRWIR